MSKKSDKEIVVEFLDATARVDKDLFIGIDPGVNGGIALLCGNTGTAVSIPNFVRVTGSKKKKSVKTGETYRSDTTRSEYAFSEINDIFRTILASVKPERIKAVVEESQSMPTDTPKTARAVGYATGMWPLFFTTLKISYALVAPIVWKREMGMLKQDKQYSRNLALRIWPEAPLGLKKDHNKAEALLLAEYYRRITGDGSSDK